MLPSVFPFTYTLHPIVHLLAYQYAATWRQFLVTNTIATLFFAFVSLPFYSYTGVLQLLKWNYVFSFLLTVAVTFLARAVMLWLANIEQRHVTETRRLKLNPTLQPAMKQLPEDQDDQDKER